MQAQYDDNGQKRTYVIATNNNYNVQEFQKALKEYQVASQKLSEAQWARVEAAPAPAAPSYPVGEEHGFSADDPRAQLSRSLEKAPYFDSVRKTAVEEKEAEGKGYKVGP